MTHLQRIEYKLDAILGLLGVRVKSCSCPKWPCDQCKGSGVTFEPDPKLTEAKTREARARVFKVPGRHAE